MLIFVTATSIATVAFLVLSRAIPAIAPLFPSGPAQWLQSLILALALAAAYVMTYPAIEIESPTLLMASLIQSRGEEGIELETLCRTLNDEALVIERLQDLCNEGLAIHHKDRFFLCAGGKRLASVFIFWRKLLGLARGG